MKWDGVVPSLQRKSCTVHSKSDDAITPSTPGSHMRLARYEMKTLECIPNSILLLRRILEGLNDFIAQCGYQ